MNISFKDNEFNEFVICYIKQELDRYNGNGTESSSTWDHFLKLLSQRGIKSSLVPLTAGINRNIKSNADTISKATTLNKPINMGS